MYFGHINNFKALLAAPVTASGTTIELKSGADKIAEVLERDSRVALTLFASDGRGGDLKREVVHATEVNGAAVTVIRGQEGTEAKEFFTDEGVEARLTAKGLDDFAHDDIVIIGSSSVLQGQAGVAIGKDVILGRENGVTEQLGTSIAIGLRATIRALNSIAVGEDATVDVSGGLSGVGDALALGRASRVTFQKSMAIGLRAECNSTDSVAMGTDAKTSGAGSLALGSQAETEFAQFSVALGHMAKASQNAAVAVGDQAKAESQEAIALGLFSTTRGHKSVSIGSESLVDVPGHIQTDVLNGRAVAVGERSTVTAEGGVAVGSDARANGTAALAVGRATRATGDHSIAVGSGANTASFEAIAIGRGASCGNVKSVALGVGASAFGSSDVCVGENSNTAGPGATAIGSGAAARANGASSFGQYSYSDSQNATALGVNSSAMANFSLSLGASSGAFGAASSALSPAAVTLQEGSVAIGLAAVSTLAGGRKSNALPYLSFEPFPTPQPLIDEGLIPSGVPYKQLVEAAGGAAIPDALGLVSEQIVLGSDLIDLTDGAASTQIYLPPRAMFFVDAFDVVVVSAISAGGSPSIQIGPDSLSESAYLTPSAVTKTAAGGRQVFSPAVQDGVTSLRVSVANAGTGTLSVKVIARGYVMEMEALDQSAIGGGGGGGGDIV